MASNFQIKRVAPGVDLVRHVTPKETIGQKFFEKMYGPAEVRLFSKQNPEVFKDIAYALPLFMGFSISTSRPLGAYVSSKADTLTVAVFTIPKVSTIFTPAQLRAENPLIVINPAICLIGEHGMSISQEFSGDVRQFIKLIDNLPTRDGWYREVDGIPKGAPVDSSEAEAFGALYLSLWGESGSLLFSPVGNATYKRRVLVGYGLVEDAGVLMQAGPMVEKLQAQPKEAKTTILSSVNEQEAYVRMAYRACNGLRP